jgi:protocatechuate 3,4-dioxygenase beta subunit
MIGMRPSTPPIEPRSAGRVRRQLLLGTAAALMLPSLPVRANAPADPLTPLAPMTEGPFYPSARWRAEGPFAGDWDADLTRVQHGGRVMVARGEHLALALTVQDVKARLIDGAQVEIWQCDAHAQYRHSRVSHDSGEHDEGFQGYGDAKSGRDGTLQFRTIRPVPYPGRTPHIHVKLRHASFGELTSQLFVAGDRGNAGDFIWRRAREADRNALALRLTPASTDGLRWQARHTLVVPA